MHKEKLQAAWIKASEAFKGFCIAAVQETPTPAAAHATVLAFVDQQVHGFIEASMAAAKATSGEGK